MEDWSWERKLGKGGGWRTGGGRRVEDWRWVEGRLGTGAGKGGGWMTGARRGRWVEDWSWEREEGEARLDTACFRRRIIQNIEC